MNQAARASRERRESQRAASSSETTPSSSNIDNSDSFPMTENRRETNNHQVRGGGLSLPTPPESQPIRPLNSISSDQSEISSPPRSARSAMGSTSNGEEMGEEASVRFLKAKLLVLQQQVCIYGLK